MQLASVFDHALYLLWLYYNVLWLYLPQVASFFDHALGISEPFDYGGGWAAREDGTPPKQWPQFVAAFQSACMRRVLALAAPVPHDLALLAAELAARYDELQPGDVIEPPLEMMLLPPPPSPPSSPSALLPTSAPARPSDPLPPRVWCEVMRHMAWRANPKPNPNPNPNPTTNTT